ncbi:MAG: DUF4404 family protein [Pirellulales bacterium]|nr:DUF4404 family protein [Pirellulales bacterium]
MSTSYAASMEKKHLLESLDALRAEVAQAGEVDPQMLAELRRLAEGLRQSLESGPNTEQASNESAPHGLKNLLLQFEADHPQLSEAVGKVANALAAMGF